FHAFLRSEYGDCSAVTEQWIGDVRGNRHLHAIQLAQAVDEKFINFIYIFIHHRYRFSRCILCHAAERHEHAETAVVGGGTAKAEYDTAGAPVEGMEYKLPDTERGAASGLRACQKMQSASLCGFEYCRIFLHIIDCRHRTSFRPGDIQINLFITFIDKTIQQAVPAVTHRFG